jgi:hypothetical protein
VNAEGAPGATVTLPVVEFIDRELLHRRDLWLSEQKHLREVMDLNIRYLRVASDLAYVELQRRLDMLNHAHEEAKQKENHYLPRENFEQFFKDFGVWRDQVNGFQSNLIGKISISVGLVGIILFLLSHYWK